MRRVRYCCAISLDGYLAGPGGDQPLLGLRTYVFSRTLRRSDYRNVTIVGEDWKAVVQSLREGPGKDIWLFGGGALFRSLAEAGMVDTVEVAVIPNATRRRHSARRRTGRAYPADADGTSNLRQDRHRQPGVRGEQLRPGSVHSDCGSGCWVVIPAGNDA